MYDVIVVGAGPAGTAASYHAARLGLRTLIVDQTAFPRPKTCGDALSPRAVAAIREMDVVELPGHPVRGMSFTHARHGAVHYHDFASQADSTHGLVVRRVDLDAILLAKAREAGAEFVVGRVDHLIRQGERVRGISMARPLGRSQALTSGLVIVASGSSGLAFLTRRRKGGAATVWGVAARSYLATHEPFGDTLEVRLPIEHRADTLFGYGWVFPGENRRVNVGVGFACTAGGIPVRKVTEEFIAERIAQDPRLAGATVSAPISVAPVAVGPRIAPIPGLILAGDAAGLVNPLTGEGIAAALESGELAARVVARGGDEQTYRTALRARFQGRFRIQASLRALYTQTAVMSGRAWDVFGSSGIIGGALSAMCWDLERAPDNATPSALRQLVADDIRLGVERYRPMLAEIVRHSMADPRSGFGRISESLGVPRGDVSPTLRRVLVAVEAANLVERLHGEMERGGAATWGSNTTRLLLADSLTALALRSLHHLDADLARDLTSTLSRRFRQAARGTTVHQSRTREPDELMAIVVRVAESCGS